MSNNYEKFVNDIINDENIDSEIRQHLFEVAFNNGYMEIANKLLSYTYINGLFGTACSNGKLEMAKYLFDSPKLDKDCEYFITDACSNQQVEMIKFLLEHDFPISIWALFYVLHNTEIVKILLDSGKITPKILSQPVNGGDIFEFLHDYPETKELIQQYLYKADSQEYHKFYHFAEK